MARRRVTQAFWEMVDRSPEPSTSWYAMGKPCVELHWTARERAWHVLSEAAKAVFMAFVGPAFIVEMAFKDAMKSTRPRPDHLRTCGTEYRGCDPECPARRWDEAYAKAFPEDA